LKLIGALVAACAEVSRILREVTLPGLTVAAAPKTTAQHALDPLLLIGSLIVVAAILTWIIPAGHLQRVTDSQSARTLIVPGSYTHVARAPVGPWGILLSIPRGLKDAADVIFFVLLAGGMLTVIEATGAIGNLLARLAARFGHRPLLLLALVAILFLIGGASDSMYEEILAFIPILCALMRRLRLHNVMAVAVSLGTATVAATFSPCNAFLLGVSQPMAQLPLFSGFAFRSVFFVLALAIWAGCLAWLLKRLRLSEESIPALEADPSAIYLDHACRFTPRDIGVLAVLNAGMAAIVLGGIFLHWELIEFSAVFLGMAILAGLIGGLGWRGTSAHFTEGLRRLVLACVFIGCARAISGVLSSGLILDTIANALFSPLQHLSAALSAIMTVLSEAALAFVIPSESGRAIVSLPVLLPVADLLGLTRQVVVLAYQSSVVVGCLLVPTAGPTLAMLAVAKVPYGTWLRHMLLPVALLLALSLLEVVAGVKLNLR
jgi:uncharacterized ion transporter superfamily protein YfcC